LIYFGAAPQSGAALRWCREFSVRPLLPTFGTLLLVALLGACGIALAQTSATLPKFEVASIRPAKPNAHGFSLWTPLGRFTATNVTAKTLIEYAYAYKQPGILLRGSQILGGPKWISSDRFDIDAKVEDSLVDQEEEKKLPRNEWADQIRLMVRSMLADRFKLKVTQETKELPIYVLVVAKHGPKLTRSTVPPPRPLGAKSPGAGPRRGPSFSTGRGRFTGVGLSVGELAGLLSHIGEIGGREVTDQTGLQGLYDFTLKWKPEQDQTFVGPGASGAAGTGVGAGAPGAGGGQSAAGTPVASDSSGPSIFTAIQQQLGLKLKPSKGPVEVVVIDHIEPPTPN
jgi:uncharacterized protein (TIGR03435 family)